MSERTIRIRSGNYEAEMEVSQEQYSKYYRPWWAQKQREKRNREAIQQNGYARESYEEWRDGMNENCEAIALSESIEEIIEKKVLLELLNEALDTLLPEEKELAVKVLGEGMSLSEYANKHDCARTTMSDKKKKVLGKLRTFFQDHGYNSEDAR